MRKRKIIAILTLEIIAGGAPAFFTANRLSNIRPMSYVLV